MATNRDIENANISYAPFNSVINQSTKKGDRTINANHLRRWLSSVNSDGVSRQFDELKLEVDNELNVILKKGIGFVDGCSMFLESPLTITLDASSTNGDRIDTIGYRLTNSIRKVLPYYKTGDVGTEKAPEIVSNSDIIEIPLWNIRVRQGATTVSEEDFADLRKYVVSSATYFKRYNQTKETKSVVSSLVITVPFNNATDDVEVLVNGIVLLDSQYSIQGNAIIFNQAIASGNEIQVNVWHFMEGTGTVDSLNKVAVLQETINTLHQYFYFCNGVDDNVKLSEIAQNFLNARGTFAGEPTYSQIEIVVCGRLGISSNLYGSGTSEDPYYYFNFGDDLTGTRTIYFNFGNCKRIEIDAPVTDGAYTRVFNGSRINIRNISLDINSGYTVDVFYGTKLHIEDSEFWMATSSSCKVVNGDGFFKNVRTSIESSGGNAFGFYSRGGLTRVIGGTHYAGTNGSSTSSASFYVINADSNSNNVLFLSMVNCPKHRLNNDDSSNHQAINVFRGYCTVMESTLWKQASFGASSKDPIAYGNVIIDKPY